MSQRPWPCEIIFCEFLVITMHMVIRQIMINFWIYKKSVKNLQTVAGDEAVEEFLEKLLGELGSAGLFESAVGL